MTGLSEPHLHAVLVDDLDIGADAGVLVNDGLLHGAPAAQAHWEAPRQQRALLQRLKVVRPAARMFGQSVDNPAVMRFDIEKTSRH